MKTNELISQLQSDLKPVTRLGTDRVRLSLVFMCTLFAVLLGIYYYSLRPNIASQLSELYFYLETAFFFISAISFISAALFSAIPGKKLFSLTKIGIVSLFLYFIVLLLRTIGTSIFLGLPLTFDGGVSWICIQIITTIGLLPLLTVLVASRRGLFTRPMLSSALIMSGGLMVGSFGIQFICPANHLAHLMVWHLLPQLIIGGLGTLLILKFTSRNAL